MGCLASTPNACPTHKAHYCACRPPGIVWTPHLTYYPQSTLIYVDQHLYRMTYLERIGLHYLGGVSRVWMKEWINGSKIFKFFIIYARGGSSSHLIEWIPIHCIMVIQRWWRRRKFRLAVGMALHTRLGQISALSALGPDLLRQCLMHV
jgi:hypothetical protein